MSIEAELKKLTNAILSGVAVGEALLKKLDGEVSVCSNDDEDDDEPVKVKKSKKSKKVEEVEEVEETEDDDEETDDEEDDDEEVTREEVLKLGRKKIKEVGAGKVKKLTQKVAGSKLVEQLAEDEDRPVKIADLPKSKLPKMYAELKKLKKA